MLQGIIRLVPNLRLRISFLIVAGFGGSMDQKVISGRYLSTTLEKLSIILLIVPGTHTKLLIVIIIMLRVISQEVITTFHQLYCICFLTYLVQKLDCIFINSWLQNLFTALLQMVQ